MISVDFKVGDYLINIDEPEFSRIIKIVDVRFYSDHPNLWLTYLDSNIYYCAHGAYKDKETAVFILDEFEIRKSYRKVRIKDKNLKILYE
jgi:hypothetical protein